MAKIKIQGNASGTGVVTLTAPNTNTDRTITLPDEDITLGGGVDGIVSTADATAITIDSSENVGIGMTSNLQHKLAFAENGAVGWQTSAGTNKADIKFETGGDTLQFSTTGTARLKLTTDGRGLSQFTAKAWVNFNGTSTPAIRDSHNVSSITDVGTGRWKANYTNTFGSTSDGGSGYCHLWMSGEGGSNSGSGTITNDGTSSSYMAGSCRDHNNVNLDRPYITALAFGD